jgi:hypothetical protein
MPAFDAPYAGVTGSPRNAPRLETLTMAPPPAALRCGIAQYAAWAAPVRLVARVRVQVSCHSSYDVVSGGWAMNTPALLISTSSRPSCSAAKSTARRTAAGSVMSACTVTWPPSGSDAATRSAASADDP